MKYILFVFLLLFSASVFSQENNQSTKQRISYKWNRLQYYNGSQWKAVADSGTGGASDTASYIPYNTPVSDTGVNYVGLSRISGTWRMVVSSKTLIDTTGGSGSSLIPKYQNDTAKQNIRNEIAQTYAVGTYTPTLTNSANITSSTASVCLYYKVGDKVTVDFYITLTPTSANTLTTLLISLPIASDLTDIRNCIGSGGFSNTGIAGSVASVLANAGSDVASVSFYPTATNGSVFGSFTYTVQ